MLMVFAGKQPTVPFQLGPRFLSPCVHICDRLITKVKQCWLSMCRGIISTKWKPLSVCFHHTPSPRDRKDLCASVNLYHKNFPGKHVPGPPRYAGVKGPTLTSTLPPPPPPPTFSYLPTPLYVEYDFFCMMFCARVLYTSRLAKKSFVVLCVQGS